MHDEKRRADQAISEERHRLIKPYTDQEEEDIKKFEIVERRVNSHVRKWLIGVLVCLCTSLLIINSFTYSQFSIPSFRRSGNQQVGASAVDTRRDIIIVTKNEIEINSTTNLPIIALGPDFVVKTKGCRIPAFEVLDPSIKQYFKDTTPFECQAGTHLPLVNSDLTSLIIDPAAKQHFYDNDEQVDCCWQKFSRTAQNDNKITFDKTCQTFSNMTKMDQGVEFVKIECRKKGNVVYKDYHAFVPRKPIVEERCKNILLNSDKNSGSLSVLILGLDAVSRLNFRRTMPNTVNILKNLGAVEMLGYNKVADNTFPNMVPVLTGMSEAELANRCWTTKKTPFDSCPFIWQNFSSAGYRTVFGEDACSMTIFNFLKSGFRDQPTDYYLRPYCVATENDIGNTHKLNADLCVGTRKTFDNLLSYGKKIAKEFSNDHYFAFFWQASLTHDFVTYPKFGDESYRKFISESNEEGLLNNTALIVMSDHGIRWGSFRQTYQGHVEESLPFVFILLPEWWREKFPTPWANLRRNSRSLTTPFDLHETLFHILKPENILEKKLSRNSSENVPRGLSWFLPIPDHRTCGMAGIPGHWCMCHLSQNASVNDPVIETVVGYLIKELNNMVQSYPQCSKLELSRILDAKIWSDESRKPDKKNSKDPPSVDYTVTIQTKPGDAIFEATVRHKKKDSNQKLVGSISRLNLYGKQSSCVDDFKMRLYCYCSSR